MSVIRWIGLFLLNAIVFFTDWLLVLLALPFSDPNNKINCLPDVLWWMNTQDDPGCDQGMHVDANGNPVRGKYEPTVKKWFDRFGWYAKTWYWLGIRNQCYGLFDRLAPHVTSPIYVSYSSAHWKVLGLDQDGKHYFCFLSRDVDVGWGWKLFNADKPAFYFRPRFWRKPSN